MKVLFLDIDGVLNSHRTAVAYGGFPFHVTDHRAMFDEVGIRLVRGICKTSGAVIVLSSSWRTDADWVNIGTVLELPIVDRTPSLLGARGKEIQHWLDAHPNVEQYAIVDDDPDMLPEQTPFFVQTSAYDGISWSNAEKLADLLGIKIFDVNHPGTRIPTPKLAWEDA